MPSYPIVNSSINNFARLYNNFEKITRLKIANQIFKKSSLAYKIPVIALGAAFPAIYAAAMSGAVDPNTLILSTQVTVGAGWLLMMDSLQKSTLRKLATSDILSNPYLRRDHTYLRFLEFRKCLALYTDEEMAEVSREASGEIARKSQKPATESIVLTTLAAALIAVATATASRWSDEILINVCLSLIGLLTIAAFVKKIRFTGEDKIKEFCKFIDWERAERKRVKVRHV